MAGQRNTGDGSMSFAAVPNYVIHEPYDHDKVHFNHQGAAEHQYQFRNPIEAFHMQSKINHLKVQHGARYHANWTFAGPGMQTIFLQSGRRSCGGTGVFLPQVQRRVGTGAPAAPSKKPGTKSKERKEDQTTVKPTKDDDSEDMMLSPEILLLPKEWTY